MPLKCTLIGSAVILAFVLSSVALASTYPLPKYDECRPAYLESPPGGSDGGCGAKPCGGGTCSNSSSFWVDGGCEDVPEEMVSAGVALCSDYSEGRPVYEVERLCRGQVLILPLRTECRCVTGEVLDGDEPTGFDESVNDCCQHGPGESC